MSAQAPHDVFAAPHDSRVRSYRRASIWRQAEPRAVRIGTRETPRFALFRRWLNGAIVLAVFLLCWMRHPELQVSIAAVLAVAGVLLTRQILTPPDPQRVSANPHCTGLAVVRAVLEWTCVAILLALMVAAFDASVVRSSLLATWFVGTGLALAIAHGMSPWLAAWICGSPTRSERYIVIGVNEVGLEFRTRMQRAASGSEFAGYFDFRAADRVREAGPEFKGHCRDVAEYVIAHEVDAVYIAIPLAATPRIKELVADLRNTTASIYFLPAIFALETVQPSYVDIDGMPALSVCDTPLQGLSATRKRTADLALAIGALAVLWPIMLGIALAVRLTSRGPILFGQKRYGMNGEEIVVYKFRSMIVCEDGPVVTQASKCDERVTNVGRFLRSTSLDELPQIFNVLEGTMSFVGPRPHAVAHNELYRTLISGYMIRHRVRPGITGWAQVNGARGETPTIDRMQQRVWYDVEYLRNWSLWLDLRILIKTIVQVVRQENAY